eukprot:973352-Amphidinium_carterae.1
MASLVSWRPQRPWRPGVPGASTSQKMIYDEAPSSNSASIGVDLLASLWQGLELCCLGFFAGTSSGR